MPHFGQRFDLIIICPEQFATSLGRVERYELPALVLKSTCP
jgi:hypothetical protein